MKNLEESLIQRIKNAVECISQTYIDAAIGPFNMLPFYIQKKEGTLEKIISKWLQDSGPPVGILTGELGSGKTIASCQLPIQLGLLKNAITPGIVIWINMGDPWLYETYPDSYLEEMLKINESIWNKNVDIRLVILDSFDEVLMLRKRQNALRWIKKLLKKIRSHASKPRILLCGRDLFLEQQFLNSKLSDLISSFSTLHSPFMLNEPFRMQLKEWSDDTLRRIMEEWLHDKYGAETACSLISNIGTNVLTSLLLLGIAGNLFDNYEIIRNHILDQKVPYFENEWELTKRLIDFIISWDFSKHDDSDCQEECAAGVQNQCEESELKKRRLAVQDIALYLVLTAQKKEGITLNSLKRILKSGFNAIKEDFFENDALYLKSHCLLRIKDGRVTIFNDAILIHLAAEALDRLLEEQKNALKVDDIYFPNSWWVQFSDILEKPGLTNLINSIEKKVSIRALQPGSVFVEVINYWIKYKWSLNVEKSDIPSFEPISIKKEDLKLHPDIPLALLTTFRNTVCRYVLSNKPAITVEEPQRMVPTLVFEDSIEGSPIFNEILRLSKILLQEFNLKGTVERGIGANSTKIFFPLATMEQVKNIVNQISMKYQDQINDRISIVMDTFQDYLLEKVIIRFQNGEHFELTNAQSKTKMIEIIKKIYGDDFIVGVMHLPSYINSSLMMIPSAALENPEILPEKYPEGLMAKSQYTQAKGNDRPLYSIIINNRRRKMRFSDTLEQIGVLSNDLIEIVSDFISIIINMISNEMPPGPPSIPPGDRSNLKNNIEDDPALFPIFQRLRQNPILFNERSNLKNYLEYDLLNFSDIPQGEIPVYTKDKKGYRRIFSQVMRQYIYIAKDLVTIGEYAEFLRETPGMDIPKYPPSCWKKDGSRITYDQSVESLPVVGISRQEAEEYIKWYARKNKNIVTSLWWYKLPRPEWLQIAAMGTQLEELSPEGNGPYGHKNLTGTIGQWTDAEEGNNVLVFGGPISSDDNIKGSAQKKLSRWVPDLCWRFPPKTQSPYIGFRLCIVDLNNNLNKTSEKDDG